jgi:hypothetical protein
MRLVICEVNQVDQRIDAVDRRSSQPANAGAGEGDDDLPRHTVRFDDKSCFDNGDFHQVSCARAKDHSKD